MGLGKTLAVRGLTLIAVLFCVLLLTVAVIGATGVSDRILNAMLNERLRGIRQVLSTQITDPDELNRAIEAIEDDLIHSYGLDQPWYVRMPSMLARIIILDLGNARTIQTFTGSRLVSDIILERLPNTILIMITVLIINFLVGLIIGVKSATRPGSLLDRFISIYSSISYAIPTWWLGLLMILVFSFYFRLFPFGGMFSAPPPTELIPRLLDLIWHAAMPIITLVIALSGSWIYITRSVVITTAQEDFVTVARAKGLSERLVMWRYIIRVAAPPILTNLMLGLAAYLGGAILTETVFSWPGMGLLYYHAIVSIDEALILALTYIFTLIYVISRFLLEVFYVILDPRVRYG
ncbi:ABC transporter permease [Candidatus Bathyarchaeota archaeon]|nr:ABC transporter permease [Candidatus Bathyarchaeota archaeon]